MNERIAIKLDEGVLDDLRTAALERMHEERAAAQRLGKRGLKLMTGRASEMAGRYLHAIQMLDEELRRVEQSQ